MAGDKEAESGGAEPVMPTEPAEAAAFSVPATPAVPTAPPVESGEYARRGGEPYRQLEGKCKTLTVMTYVMIGVAALSAISYLNFYLKLDEWLDPSTVPTDEGFDNLALAESLTGFTGYGVLLVAIPLTVVLVLWFRAAYRNLNYFKVQQRYRQGWAVWSWFVPIWQSFRPVQMANDMTKAIRRWNPQTKLTPNAIAVWWGLVLVAGFLAMRDAIFYLRAETLEELRTSSAISVAYFLIEIVALLAMLWFIRNITREQTARQFFVTTATPAADGERKTDDRDH